MDSEAEESEIAFGRWRLRPRQRELLRDGVAVPLGSRAFDLLLALVDARGELVTKDELLRRVWPGTIVEENNLQVQVSALRKAMGEDAPRLIATIPGRGYRFTGAVQGASTAVGARAATAAAAPPEAASPPIVATATAAGRPTMVVLPFTNMTGDAEQEYFADGITEELTTALSHARWFSVIARNSAFTYKGRAVDVRRVGRDLGVGYVLEGSVRKVGGRVRITAQLCETDSGRHVWAERFDGELADIFDLQDRVTEAVAVAIEPSLRQAEGERVRARPTESLGAYDLYLRALPHRFTTREASDEALGLLRQALILDPHFVAAKGALAMLTHIRIHQRWAKADDIAEAAQHAREVVEGGGAEDPGALAWSAYVLATFDRDFEAAVPPVDRALLLAPNSVLVMRASAPLRAYLDEWRTSIAQYERAIRLSPLDPGQYFLATGMSFANFAGERYEEAVVWARRAVHDRPSYLIPHRFLVSSLAWLGRTDEARAAVQALCAVSPGETFAGAAAATSLRGRTRERYLEGLRRAGLPE